MAWQTRPDRRKDMETIVVSKRIKLLLLGLVTVVLSSTVVVVVLLRSDVYVKSIEFKRMYFTTEEGSVKVSDQLQQSLVSENGKCNLQEVANYILDTEDANGSATTKQMYDEIVVMYDREKDANDSINISCPHPSVFRSWRQGIVTHVGPPLQRDCHRLRQNPVQEANRSHLDLQLDKWRASCPWVSLALKYIPADEL